MTVVGVGGAGSLADGGEFVSATGVRTPTMLLDSSLALWQHYDVFSQPTMVLVDPAGNLVYEFPGSFNAQDVLARL